MGVDSSTVATRRVRDGARTAVWVLGGILALGVLLRIVDLGRPTLDFDETFTAVAARMPLGQMFNFLRHHDAHPPLQYLLSRPAALAGGSEAALRLPAALLSVAALGVFAWWMRSRGRVGLIATAIMAVSAFQITYARDARMYAGMVLVGVIGAFAADRWLRGPRRSYSVTAGAALLVGLFFHGSALVFAGALMLVPLGRRDEQAWWWRGSIASALAVWACVWGPSFLDQFRDSSSSWIPHTTPAYLAGTLNELVTSYGALKWLVVGLVAFGLVLLSREDRTTGRLLGCLFVAPVVAAAVIGLRAHFLLPRSLAFLSWAPLLALAAFVDAALKRWSALGVVAIVGVAALLLPSTAAAVPGKEPAPAAALGHLRGVARDGDVVAIHPHWLSPLTRWYLSVKRPGPETGIDLPRLDADTFVLGGGPWSGRVWLVEPDSYTTPDSGLQPCGPTWTSGHYRVLCLERTVGS